MVNLSELSKTKAVELVKYVLFFGLTFRAMKNFAQSPTFFTVVGLLAIFIVFYSLLPVLHRKIEWSSTPILLILSAIIIGLSFQEVKNTPPRVDYFVVLFVLPIMFVGTTFDQRKAFWWDIFFSALMIACMVISYGFNYAIEFIIIYLAIFIFIASYVAILRKAEESDRNSKRLLSELKSAHLELKQFAGQAKEIAIVEERNRLARELHDSVTQTIFSMTLTMDSIKILMEKDQDKIPDLIERLQTLARDALAEMRTLITQLRPQNIEKEGLVSALQQHIDERKTRDGLEIEFDCNVNDDVILPKEVEENLFRMVQEAINNIVKHAQVTSASISLEINDIQILLTISDNGIGFNPEVVVSDETHLGLVGIQERASKIGADINIYSKPGKGTTIKIEQELTNE